MGYFWGDDARLRLSSERRVDRDQQPREVVDGHGAHRDELDGVGQAHAPGLGATRRPRRPRRAADRRAGGRGLFVGAGAARDRARRRDGAAGSTGAHRGRGRCAATAAREATEAVRGAAAREPVAAFFCGGGRGWVVSSKCDFLQASAKRCKALAVEQAPSKRHANR